MVALLLSHAHAMARLLVRAASIRPAWSLCPAPRGIGLRQPARLGDTGRALAAIAFATTLLVLASIVPPAAATMLVKRISLSEISQSAACIVHATVSDVRLGRDESGLPATWVTLMVSRCLKGSAGDQVTIKQYGVSEPLPDGTVAGMSTLPHYKVGEELVLFLHGESDRGFTSPVGMTQGVYRVTGTGAQRRVRGDAPTGGERRLDDFLSEVKQHTASTR
jgi:hypothetical protein